MFDLEVTWTTPLEVKLQSGLHRKFRSANDAADFMETEWPTHHGNHYERALMYCRAAVRRQVCAEVAREAFLAACLEAGLDVGNGTWRQRRSVAPEFSQVFQAELPRASI